jgi:hypothetical protein
MNLREAARCSVRSVTTLRRYIRRGVLRAEKRPGRFGPEYFVSEEALVEAGLPPRIAAIERPRTEVASGDETVPGTLYRDLQLKHEQLLVQYGMMRVGGLRALELRGELDDTRRRLEEAQARAVELRRRLADETARLAQRLRKAELEGESRQIEVDALREKVRALEVGQRSAGSGEPLERQFADLMAQARRVRDLAKGTTPAADPARDGLDH